MACCLYFLVSYQDIISSLMFLLLIFVRTANAVVLEGGVRFLIAPTTCYFVALHLSESSLFLILRSQFLSTRELP